MKRRTNKELEDENNANQKDIEDVEAKNCCRRLRVINLSMKSRRLQKDVDSFEFQ